MCFCTEVGACLCRAPAETRAELKEVRLAEIHSQTDVRRGK